MQRPRFIPDISVGNLLSMLTVVIAAAGAYYSAQGQIDANRVSIERLEAQAIEFDKSLAAMRQSTQDRESKTLELLTELRVDVRYLRESVSALQRGQDQGRTPP